MVWILQVMAADQHISAGYGCRSAHFDSRIPVGPAAEHRAPGGLRPPLRPPVLARRGLEGSRDGGPWGVCLSGAVQRPGRARGVVPPPDSEARHRGTRALGRCLAPVWGVGAQSGRSVQGPAERVVRPGRVFGQAGRSLA
eukprot:CAMPEP_0180190092 /NCGR_PEP_ID=MMETSP0987-20121128/694_1 /TAXON_ID=697907 /ORGANISM="non described non described, Strain CCMP2293" /LENGTH=139 /DNA_ID=CAMNT_0022144493 /DNA_START=364 /DNA_END=783 /DNA_ORIENTATION=+